MPLLFSITLFVSALLLFLIQPMIAKMILPLLGGTPAVWNTCMVFFQAVLLAGYSYAHVTTTWLGVRRQVLLHGIVLLLPLLVLPIGVAKYGAPPAEAYPIPWLLGVLLLSVGLPFFVLATSAPLLQKWFASTGHPSARDPYFLYAASNLGSMLALLSYPTIVEPLLPLKATAWLSLSQSSFWAVGYGLLAVLVAICAWAVLQKTAVHTVRHNQQEASDPGSDNAGPPPFLRRLHWIALAFVPSSLMLGVTNHISIDIAAIPLLWVIPLSLYLLSFIFVFSKLGPLLHKFMTLVTPVILLLLLFAMESGSIKRIDVLIPLHLLNLFAVAMVCHGELARTRPSARYLTEFYLLMSLGGVLGGLFNALVAPVVFHSIVEYPLAIVLACLLVPSLLPEHRGWLQRWVEDRGGKAAVYSLDLALAVLVGLVTYGIRFFLKGDEGSWRSYVASPVDTAIAWISGRFEDPQSISEALYTLLAFVVPILLAYAYIVRPVRFGLAVAAFLVALALWRTDTDVIRQERSFFGVLKVSKYSERVGEKRFEFIRLDHGTTLHGMQSLDPELRHEPLTYFHRTGPIGQVFAAFEGTQSKQNVAIIGLGSGTLACCGVPGQNMTFFDIDPAVVKIARNPEFFTNLADCRANWDVVLGDARLQLERVADASYQLLIVDAFSSDSIPIHLITREAIELYFNKLTPDGVLAIHISNRYLDLEPVLGNFAVDLGLVGLYQYDTDESPPGKSRSEWAVLAREARYLGSLATDDRWRPIQADPKVGVWTDDFSNLLQVFHWHD